MKLFWAPQTRAQRGIWMLEEAAIDYEMERIDLGSSERSEEFTAADVILGSSAIFLRMFEMLPDNRNISAYADRCSARTSYQRAAEKGAA